MPCSPRSTPSYSSCATVIVFLGEKRRRLDASCCRVLVVYGAGGWRRGVLRVTVLTTKVAARHSPTSAWASASDLGSSLVVAPSCRRPTSFASKALRWRPRELRRAVTVQYSSGTKARISFSRSQIRRSATLCTRPALVLPRTLRQRMGLILYPTR